MTTAAPRRIHQLIAFGAALVIGAGIAMPLLATAEGADAQTDTDAQTQSFAEMHEEATGILLEADTTSETCLSCHTYDDIVEATDDYAGLGADGHGSDYVVQGTGANPHRAHLTGQLECTDCHTLEMQPILICNDCHFFPLPEGWTDAWGGAGSTTLSE